jgi:hypothetical protein
MDSNTCTEILHLRHKAEVFADSMWTGFLCKNDAWYALATTIMKTMEYPMATATLTGKEWNYGMLVVPILQLGLPHPGIDRAFHHDILYGPSCVQGFGLLHPWFHQEITHLMVALQQMSIGGTTGQLRISASMELLPLEVGLSGWLSDPNLSVYQGLTTTY